MENIKIGKIGEDIAYKYLLNKGYLILARNYREKNAEIDIIARDINKTLVFCEVKTLSANNKDYLYQFMPEDNLTPMKFKKMLRGSRIFISRNSWSVDEDSGWRMDLLAIVLKNGNRADLRHYKNI